MDSLCKNPKTMQSPGMTAILIITLYTLQAQRIPDSTGVFVKGTLP